MRKTVPVSSGLIVTLTWLFTTTAWGQLSPEIGYVYPPGGSAGSTIDVRIGGYDWTPDMQLFPHDSRLKLELTGAPSKVLVPDPPYWFGAKGRGYAWPLPREFPARLTIPAEVTPGLYRWQVANANGTSAAGTLHISGTPEVVEDERRSGPVQLPALPVTVSGQIRTIEEVDEYRFKAEKNGPVRVELWARRLGSPLHALLRIRDAAGRTVLDIADTEGRDLSQTFVATAGTEYIVSLHDHDFAGDRSYVYRLELSPGPKVSAAYPVAGKRGQSQAIEFVGQGLQTGTIAIESITQTVAIPADPQLTSFTYVLETPHGRSQPVTLAISDAHETVAAEGTTQTAFPVGITSAVKSRLGSAEFPAALTKDKRWKISVSAREIGSPLDLELQILNEQGQELLQNDDSPGTTDPVAVFVPPADGTYRIRVTDRSGKSGSRLANFRLLIEPEPAQVIVAAPAHLNTPLGTPLKVAVTVTRSGGFAGPVTCKLTGVPEGLTVPAEIVIPGDKAACTIELPSAADGPATASLAQLAISYQNGDQQVTRTLPPILLATIMAPRIKITPEGLDDVRKVHRGSTFLAPLLIERLQGYTGEMVLEMTSKQQRHRQGLASEEFTVPVDATRVEYPIFVPEWMETTKTSRMILNGVVKVPDPRGTVRTLVNKMELRIGILPEGALLKLAHSAGELSARPGDELTIPLQLSRSAGFNESVMIEVVPPPDEPAAWSATAVPLPAGQSMLELKVRLAPSMPLRGDQTFKIRALALQNNRWPVATEVTIPVEILEPATK